MGQFCPGPRQKRDTLSRQMIVQTGNLLILGLFWDTISVALATFDPLISWISTKFCHSIGLCRNDRITVAALFTRSVLLRFFVLYSRITELPVFLS